LNTKAPLDISICAYSNADFEAVIATWFASGRSIGVSAPTTLDDLRERWPRELAAGSTAYVAKAESTVVGFFGFKNDTLEQLYVAPQHQGRGVGKTLLDFAKSQMPGGFHLSTPVVGRGSKFYEREGLKRGATSLHRFGFEMVRYDWHPNDQ
jgi:GNAT superfamily N-acetyltransferase